MGDSELIAAAVAGEKAALEQLVGRHAPRVYRFAMRICRNQEDAQEILQDTFLRRSAASARSGERASSPPGSFGSWSPVVPRFEASAGVVQAHEIPLEAPEGIAADHPIHPHLMDWSQDPETSSLSAEAREYLEVAIDRLSHEYKGVLVLRDVEGFSTSDTAEILNLSPEAVKSRPHRARLFLREQLAHYFTDR